MSSHALGTWKIAAVVAVAVLLLSTVAQAGPLHVRPGYNFLATPTGTSYTTVSLPAGFFGQKNGVPSDPIVDRIVRLEGRPTGSLGLEGRSSVRIAAGNCHSRGGHHHCHENATSLTGVDTITLIGGTSLGSIGDRNRVTLQIVSLSLQTPGPEPLVVTYKDEPPSLFHLILNLDPTVTQDVGHIWFNRTEEDGGIMEVALPVAFKVVAFDSDGRKRFGPVSMSTVLESKDNGFTVRGD